MNFTQGLAIALSLALSQASFGQANRGQADGVKPAAEVGVQTYIVKFVEPGLMYYNGGQPNLRGTSSQATGNRKFNARAPEAQAYSSFLANQQESYLAQIASEITFI